MPLVASNTVADRHEGALENAVARINAEASLRPSNYFENWHFDLIGDDGDPVGLEVGMPEDPDGFFVYLSERGKGPQTMTAQNLSPIPIEQPSFVFNQARVDGNRPTEKAFAAPIAPPDAPSLRLVNDSQRGFPAGDYFLSYNYFGKGQRTGIAPAVRVTVLQGQSIRVFLPQDVPEGVTSLGIWVGRGQGSMRMVRRVSTRFFIREFVNLTGYRSSPNREPSRNETKRGRPNRPRLRVVREPGGVLKKGRYRARTTNVDEAGESEPSDYSEQVVVPEDRRGHAIEAVLDPDHNPPRRPRTGSKRRKRDGSRAPRGRDAGGDLGESIRRLVRLYVERDGKEFVFRDKTQGSKNRPMDPREEPAVRFGGETEDDDERGNRTTLSSTTPPSETDDTGIEPPTAGLEQPLAYGEAILVNGAYWVAIAHSVRGQVTTISEPRRVSAESFVFGKVLRVVFPDPVEGVKNPTMTERDSFGIPFDHAFVTGAAGSQAFATEEGEAFLSTNGLQTGTALTPSHFVEFDVDREDDFRVSGEMSANLAAGLAEAHLQEFDEFNAPKGPGYSLAREGGGAFGYERVMGPSGTAWQADTVKARVTHRFVGDPAAATGTTTYRNGTILAWAFSAVRGLGVPRLALPAPPASRERDDTDPPKETRKRRGAQKVVGLAPRGQRRPPATSVIDSVDFGQGASVFPANWTQRITVPAAADVAATGIFANTDATPTIDGDRSYHVQKTTTGGGLSYIHRQIAPTTRQKTAQRAKFRVRQLPSRGAVSLMFLTGTVSDGGGPSSGQIRLFYNGVVEFLTVNGTTPKVYRLGSGIVAGDVLDLELVVSGAGTLQGYANAALGKNGSTRVFYGRQGPFDLRTRRAHGAVVGPALATEAAATWSFDFDSITITETGDVVGGASRPPTLRALKLPDRPYRPPVALTAETFDTGSLSPGWTLSPAQPGNTREITRAAALSGTHGLRSTSTQGDTQATAMTYVQHVLPATRPSAGLRARYRFNTLPASGSVLLGEIADAQGRRMATLILEEYAPSAFRVSVRAFSPATGTARGIRPVAVVSAGTTVTLELAATGAGGGAGLLSGWVGIQDASVPLRSLLTEVEGVDWTGSEVSRFRAGTFEESSAAMGWSIDVDDILVTEAGEVQFREQSEDGTEINQMHVFYPKGQPVRDDLFFRGWREAVAPGAVYTASVQMRYRGVPLGAQPFFFTAHDLFGNAYDLGSVVGDGTTQRTRPWDEYSVTLPPIPAGCHEVRMESRGVGAGEWVVQEFCFSDGTQATPEVYHAPSGTAEFVLDTNPYEGRGYVRFGRIWRSAGCALELPEGTSASVSYSSSASRFGPFSAATPDPLATPRGRFLRVRVRLGASPDGRRTPVVPSGSPFVDYALVVGTTQIATLLREDRSEFPGGTILTGLQTDYDRSRVSRRTLPGGGVRVTRLGGDPVGRLPGGATVGVFNEEAARVLQETDEDLVVEARDRFLVVRPEKEVEFSAPKARSLLRRGVGDWKMWAEGPLGPCEVVEEGSLPLLVGPGS